MLARIALLLFLNNLSRAVVVFDCGQSAIDTSPTVIEISEVDPIGTVIAEFNNTYAPLRWSASDNGTSAEYLSTFFSSSEKDNGQTYGLKLKKVLDLELMELELPPITKMVSVSGNSVTLELSASCKDESNTWEIHEIQLIILRVNEFVPAFIGAPFKITVSEDTIVGSRIFDIGHRALDMDAGPTQLSFNIAPYMITEFDGRHLVTMDDNTRGHIILSRTLDFESFLRHGRTFFFLNITVSDEGGLTSATSLNVSVSDANDQGIQFVYSGCARPCISANYSVNTNESYKGMLDVSPRAILVKDMDTLNSPVDYSIISDEVERFFSIDAVTGQIYKTAELVNDTFGFSILLEVLVKEITNEDHFVHTNVTVYISDRMPEKDEDVMAIFKTKMFIVLL